MLETFLSIALFGSFVWWCIVTTVILFVFFVSEVKENGYVAFGFAIAYLTLFYFKGNQDLGIFLDWNYLLMYLGVGLIYSVLRTLIFGIKKKKEVQKHVLDNNWINSKKDAIGYKKDQGDELLRKLSGNVSRWWFMWPISLVVWILRDLAIDVWEWSYKKVHKVFEAIFVLGFGKDDDIVYDEKENK